MLSHTYLYLVALILKIMKISEIFLLILDLFYTIGLFMVAIFWPFVVHFQPILQ